MEADSSRTKTLPCATCSNLQRQINELKHDHSYPKGFNELKHILNKANDLFDDFVTTYNKDKTNLDCRIDKNGLIVDNQVDLMTLAPPTQWATGNNHDAACPPSSTESSQIPVPWNFDDLMAGAFAPTKYD